MVKRIAARLEQAGHDAWIDTDDIIGSERWRASIAEAITGADVVLLMVSPAAVRSENVEREITVAAEEDRRIVPVVIEPAEIPVGLLYDLAGVQRVSFVGRSFEDAMSALLAAIELPGAVGDAPRTTSAALPARSGASTARSRRRLAWIAAGGLVVVAVGIVLSNGARAPGADPTGVELAAATDGAGDATPAVSVADDEDTAPTRVELAAEVWFAGFTIEATGVRFDPDRGIVDVDVVFTNDQYGNAQPCELFLDDAALLVAGRRVDVADDSCTWLPPGTSTRSTLTASVDADVDLATATLEFGSPDEHRAVVPLDGSPATSEFPISAPFDGTIESAVSTFVAERVDVVPGTCWLTSDVLQFDPARIGEASIVVTGSATSRNDYPLGYGTARLTLPDGTELASESLDGVIYAIDPGQTERDVRACFTVPTPVEGEYRFTITDDSADALPEPITLTL